MTKTRADYIREELGKDFNAPAQEIADRLQKRGIVIDPQHVYQVRSDLRKKGEERKAKQRLGAATRMENTTPLADLIVKVLYAAPEGLTDREIEEAVREQGYKTRSADFLDTFARSCTS